ncbi:MAG: DNA polymerase I [Varibaculum sp.]|nr:DNA polymerase I [Varibaculum sp.]
MAAVQPAAGETLMAIDGHSIAFRAYFALQHAQGFTTSGGQATAAVYSFLRILLKLLREWNPERIAVAFDLSRRSFRTEEYPEYKAGRDETPKELIEQVELIKELLDAMGIQQLTKENYEADDILATLAVEGEKSGMRVLVVSGDRDSFQLITDQVNVLYPGRSMTDLRQMTPAAIQERYGVAPQQYPEIAALVGEHADNLPGVPMVGEKIAAGWINQYGGLEGIFAHVAEIGGKRGESLRDNLDNVRRNRRLNHLVTDLDLGISVTDIEGLDFDVPRLERLFDKLEFGSIRKEVFGLTKAEGQTDTSAEGFQDRKIDEIASDIPPLDWLVPQAPVAIAIAGESGYKTRRIDRVALAQDSEQNKRSTQLIDLTTASDQMLTDLKQVLASFPLIVHSAKDAMHSLKGEGLEMGKSFNDISIMAYLLYSDMREYSVSVLARKYLDYQPPEPGEPDLFGTADYSYLTHEAGALIDLNNVLGEMISRRSLQPLLHEIELPLERILFEMEQLGIAVSAERMEQLHTDLQYQVESAQAAARADVGRTDLNLSSPKQLQEVLFDQLGLPKTRKTKTGYTTNAEALVGLYQRSHHPFLEHLLEHRDSIKLLQIVEGLISAIATDGRIHTRYHQNVTATGRLSSSEPNLQNIPIRTETGRRIRSAFVASMGYENLMSADYSQIEMRIMADLCGDEELIRAFASGEDLHRTMAAMVFGVPAEQVTPDLRSRVKATSYGLAYGLSAYGLSQQLKIPQGEAQQLMDRYFQRFGKIRDFLEATVAEARKRGYTTTQKGRRRYFNDLNSSNRQLRAMAERAALNAPIQGQAADIMKSAMIRVARALDEQQLKSRLLLQIHDELILEIAPGEAEQLRELVTREMTNTTQMRVPLTVSIGVGYSWQEAAH